MPLACAFAQSGPNGFAPGNVFLTETGAEGCRAQRSWIREFDPLTGESWLIADYFDGLCGNSGLAFTPDGSRLRVLNLSSNDVMDFDSNGIGAIVYDSSHGLGGPFGGNGLAWGREGNFFVANEYSQQVLHFSPDAQQPVVLADQNDGITGGGGLAVMSNGDLLLAEDRLLRITRAGVVSVFDPYFVRTYPVARTLARSKNGTIYLGARHIKGVGSQIHKYENEDVNSRQVIANGFSSYNWMSIALSEDESVLYVVDNWSLYSVDLTTYERRLLFTVPADEREASLGRGIAVYKAPQPGDMNCDNWVNNFDIDPFVLALTDEAGYQARFGWCDRTRADVNRDGTIDNFDIDAFVEAVVGDTGE
ncbi:MAG: hypothetical protein JNG88_15640 [Phycisphaerales bacterium]|nr:hypothetical protein [Phycisphaerales bacterium]